ncbi:MAG: retroviral-like aspartic protease family protein [Muribaculaceae bacterium]|nr:retroviral-like aspartic protease family protein [Muribaculaceae bacterium]
MLRQILIGAFIGINSLIGYSQSVNEKILNAINHADWFGLDSIYYSVPKDSIHPYLEVSARGFIGHKLNRPELSVPAFQELFTSQSDYLDLNNFISSAVMFGKDLNRVGENEFAASMIKQTIDATGQYLDSAAVANLTLMANWYSALAAYNTYQIQDKGDSVGKVPFAIVPMGPKEKGGVIMQLRESAINGMSADIMFDTGCASSIISPEMAEKYGLIPLDGTKVSVDGVGKKDGYLAIAKELQLGNITVKDVPFTVASMSLSSVNEEAARYADAVNIILGNDLMLQLKDITVDFVTNNLTVPSEATAKTDAKPNMCFDDTRNLLCKCEIQDNPLLMLIDSGDASYGTLGEEFFEHNKQFVVDNGTKTTVRQAGIGGVKFNERYLLSDMKLSVGGHAVEIPEIDVRTRKEEGAGSESEGGVLGLRSLMLYSSVRFNFVDFVLTTGLPRINSK